MYKIHFTNNKYHKYTSKQVLLSEKIDNKIAFFDFKKEKIIYTNYYKKIVT